MSPFPFRKLVNAICVPSGDHAGASFPTTSKFGRAEANGTPARSSPAPNENRRIRRIVPSSIPHRLSEMFGAVIAIMLAGFVTGALARLAVPGPDPMPIWLTIAIGLAGSWGGGAVAAAIWGWNSTSAVSIFGFVAAILLVIAYRRFYQGRPLTGPDAMKFPERGIGIDKLRERQAQAEQMVRQAQHAQAQAQVQDVTEQIRKLGELRDEGVLTDEEFETKKRELLARL
jgi:uncharacterized membrane protein YeaQ/YmgE (transglycosylase-associated protein family)